MVMGRAFYIQRFQGEHWRSMSDSMHQKFVEMDAERGTIYSEDGEMLSTSIPFFDIYIDFGAEGLREKNGKRFRENIDSFAIGLAGLFGEKASSAYKQELQTAYNEKDRYFLLRKDLSFDQYKTFRTLPLVKLGRNKSGVIAEVKTRRLNPFGILARRTIGLSRKNAQNVGLERTYDSLLKGTTGKRLVRFIAGGAYVPVEGYEIDPENGKDVITTLDVNIQDIAENALMKMMVQSESEWGTCIVMETQTGKIKAIANLGRTADGSYDENLNYALQTTEPGSTIKLATLLAVLEEKSAKINDMVEVGTEGRQFVGVRNITDAERSPKAVMTVKECFAHSSNVGMSKLAYKAFAQEPDKFKNYLHKFWLDRRTNVGLLGEEAPVMPRLKRNKEGIHAMLTASFGYAIEVSPLHTLMLYNAIANNGRMMKPYLVNSILSNGVVMKQFDPVVLDEKIVDDNVVRDAKLAMEAVATEGTAKAVFENSPFSVAGKTGTAHVAGKGLSYEGGVYQASFVGYFPADRPEYTCIVIIKTKPHAPLHYGGQLAAPVFKEVATKLFAMYVHQGGKMETKPDSTAYEFAGYSADMKNVLTTLRIGYRDSAQKNKFSRYQYAYGNASMQPRAVASKVMPDVQHMSLKDALYVLENMDLKVSVTGQGRVVAQSVPAGSAVLKKSKVSLLLN
jgi:cell division protein FtsI (penicillin-binding protein 3)